MVISELLGLSGRNERENHAEDCWGSSPGRLTSSSCFSCRSCCFATKPSRTRFAALLCSACRTSRSPFPSFAFPAASRTRPASAFLRCAGVRFSSGFKDPDRIRVCTSLCRRASFCALVLWETDDHDSMEARDKRGDTYSSSSPSSVSSDSDSSLTSCLSFVTLDDFDNGRGQTWYTVVNH